MADRVLVGKEYAAVLHECRDAYFKQRRALLLDPVRDRIQTAASQGQNDLGAIARQGCALLCDVCHREYKLHAHRPGYDHKSGVKFPVLVRNRVAINRQVTPAESC